MAVFDAQTATLPGAYMTMLRSSWMIMTLLGCEVPLAHTATCPGA